MCSPGLSVGSKLCFLCLHLPKFFYAIIDFSCNCFFSWYVRDAGFSHMYTELKRHLLCSVKTLSWSGVGAGSSISIPITRHYLNWLNFVLRVKGCRRVSLLPNRPSSNVFFFLFEKSFRLRKLLFMNSPKC